MLLSVPRCLCLYLCAFVHVPFPVPLCLFVYTSIPLFLPLYLCLYLCTFVCTSIPLSVPLYLCLYLCTSIPFACTSVPFACTSVPLSVPLYVCLPSAEQFCIQPLTPLDSVFLDSRIYGQDIAYTQLLEDNQLEDISIFTNGLHVMTSEKIGCSEPVYGWEFIPGE